MDKLKNLQEGWSLSHKEGRLLVGAPYHPLFYDRAVCYGILWPD